MNQKRTRIKRILTGIVSVALVFAIHFSNTPPPSCGNRPTGDNRIGYANFLPEPQLGNTKLDPAVLKEDFRTCKKIGPCGIGQ